MMLMTILLPGLPRIRLTASESCMSLVDMPSILTIRSPGRMPARKAGVPSMGVTTVRISSLRVISMPRPPNWPVVSTPISRYMSGSRKEECASRPRRVPLMALYTRSLGGTSSTYWLWMIESTSVKRRRFSYVAA